MRHVLRRLLVATVAATLALAMLGAPSAVAQSQDDYEVLVVGKTLGFRHSHIPLVTETLIDMGEDNGFSVDVWDPPNDSGGWWGPGSPGQPDLTLESTPFTSGEDLSQYDVIIFVSPVDNTNSLNPETPRLLDDAELAALQGYVHAGGGVVGIHAATDTMHTSEWFTEMMGGGARFRNHPQQQNAVMVNEDPNHPTTEMLPLRWERWDEWYNYTQQPEDVHVLLSLDESTYNPGSGAMGEEHPIAWCQNFEGGRVWYEGAGHTDESWEDPLFTEHILAGIEWAAGRISGGGDCVTFGEVDELVDDLAPMARSGQLVANLGERLRAAEDYVDAGDDRRAMRELQRARHLARVVGRWADDDGLLMSKVEDLIEWRSGEPTSAR